MAAACLAGFAEWHAMQPTARALTGELWRQMSPDAKVAFVSGIGALLDVELAQAATRSSIDAVVRQVDEYYETYPSERERSVIETIVESQVATGRPE